MFVRLLKSNRKFNIRTKTTMSNFDPATLHNPYFNQKSGQKDIWTLINETAAEAQKESGKSIVNLGQGFFSYNPPDFAIEAVNKATSQPQFNQYASARGNPNLLNELSSLYTKEFNRKVGTDEIQITTGANEGMFSIFFGYLTPGDEVIVFQPFFDQYIPNIEMCGGKVKYVQLKFPEKFNGESVSGDDWEVDWEGLTNAITDKTKLIVINTPHNPIGKVFTEEELYKIGKIAIGNNLILVSDEVYENLYYSKSFTRPATLSSLPELAERTLTIGSAGKSFAATGWRVGWVHGPASLIKYVTAAHTRICFSTPAPLQQAVADGLKQAASNKYFEITRQEYVKKYELFTKVFDELNLPYTSAQGGYFLLVNLSKVKIPNDFEYPADISDKGTNDFKLAYWLIKEIGVVGIPPTEFLYPADRQGNGLENCLRFAVCKDNSILEEAVEKLRLLKEYL
ncbi:DEHA2A04818p [Debaryomyces hansenii CBS767]|uniref:DEHA2A04818p n=1 Tax=Debaryomyces hansenii (strain ATCC 36239 / CBS 767 / BCRC 21394 / JCM 1990 / NBRC 0083 / IGC 2968) TaxID=284592 RepID=Q6BZ38_DEBHA|nr:DEHA2A04818p [Debaryomyces hansenii CBS767]CAG84486.2 DEHA2A04818p [Debaryomyces hansenii CBS767]|eukprot:XP_456531.2 DEHA2A04818p [Debaryomyces hansenii CBS767]